MNSLLMSLKAWWTTPFSANMDGLQVFLLVGLVLASLVLWMIVLSHLRNVKLTG